MISDYARGTRLSKSQTSAYTKLEELYLNTSRKDNLRFAFYVNPDTNNTVRQYGQSGGLREIFGVHHMKLHVFDDNVLITGANLSDDYFTNR